MSKEDRLKDLYVRRDVSWMYFNHRIKNKISDAPINSKQLPVKELRHLYDLLKPMSIEERKDTFGLKDDRADVIVPAARIFLDVAKQLQCDDIYVPNISLADSIVDGLYKEVKNMVDVD